MNQEKLIEVQKSHISRIESNASNGYTYLEQCHFSQLEGG